MTKISAKIIKDSYNGERLTTVEVVMPRMILAEFNTHRVISKNSASSRAIPFSKTVQRVIEDPFIPYYWSKNQKGMAANELETVPERIKELEWIWLTGRDAAVDIAGRLDAMGMHKQVVNRVLEPYMWHTVVATATEWNNFLKQRVSKSAEPHMALTAVKIHDALSRSLPETKKVGEWHLPFVDESDGLDLETSIKVSVARCARTSYLNHNGKRDSQEDLNLFERLMSGMHFSPMEHVAQSVSMEDVRWGMDRPIKNFKGWKQYRCDVPNENWTAGFRLSQEDSDWIDMLENNAGK